MTLDKYNVHSPAVSLVYFVTIQKISIVELLLKVFKLIWLIIKYLSFLIETRMRLEIYR